MSTTFDPNRVGPGTFELVQDPSTGVYSLKQVGFTKLPSLTLPTLGGTSTATTTTKQTTKQAESVTDTGPKVIQPTGGAEDRVEIPTIGPIPGGARDDAAKVSQNLQSGFLASGAAGGARLPSTSPQEGFLASGAAGGASLQVDENKVDLGNPTGDPRVVSEEQGLVGSRVPDAIKTGQPAVGMGVPDAVKFGQPAPPDRNIIQKASDLIKNSASLKLAETGLKMAGTVATGIGDALLGVTDVDKRRREADSSAAKSLGLKTRGELGSSTDPGRIAMSPADHVLGGLNRDSARGDLSKAASDRIVTRMTVGQARVDAKYGKDSKRAKDFREKTKEFQKQANEFNSKKELEKAKKGTKSQNPNLRAGAEGGGRRNGKIVCTMMNESYGFGSFRNKIWLRQSKNLAPEYQIGYHKLFLPLVKYAKQKGTMNNIVKKILEHIAIHRTIDIRQQEKNKIHLIGRIYRKILEPICYWAGKL